MTESSTTQRFRPRPGIMVEEVDGELMLLDLDGDVFFGLNEVGAMLWKLLGAGDTLEDCIDAVAVAYADSVERATVEADAHALLAELLAQRLLEPRLAEVS